MDGTMNYNRFLYLTIKKISKLFNNKRIKKNIYLKSKKCYMIIFDKQLHCINFFIKIIIFKLLLFYYIMIFYINEIFSQYQ